MNDSLKEFIRDSNTFNGFVFNGCYNMSSSHFLYLFEHYINTGENLLDSYSQITYATWGDNGNSDDRLMYQEEYDKYISLLVNPVLSRLFSENDLRIALSYVKKCYGRFRELNSYSNRRLKACVFTSNSNVRKKVFKLHGRKCLKCNSTDDIQLDHIVSVKDGGTDMVDNLQPLCKKCNIEKGATSKDYRSNI